jgi:regulatory protein
MRKNFPPISASPDLHNLLLHKAGALLARRSYSRGELKDKLSKLAGASQVEAALDRLQQLKLLNDSEYAYNFALCRMKHQGWSPARVRQSLARRKIGQEIVENALERVRAEMGSVSALAIRVRKYCEKAGIPADLKQTRKLIEHLRRRGFDEDSILSELSQRIPAALLRRFETGE